MRKTLSDTQGAPVYLDAKQPISQRVKDLLSRMTLDEKISQMRNTASAIPRLQIPAYDYWSEALHGVARNGRATVFPQAIGLAATWDPVLIQRIASAIGDEGRAKHHEAMRRNGESIIYQGLTFWSPNINIFRDPRWGRGQETWGEDPYLTGEMGAAFVRGLQGEDPKYLKTAACAKHFAVHSGPEKLRHEFDARVSMRELYDTYLPAFRKLVVEAGVEIVMGAYNRTNGEPCCASQLLLVDILREQWNFKGHVVSDCAALTDIHAHHKVTKDVVESAALALTAGCDLSCICTYDHLGEAIDRGLIREDDIDRALERTLGTRFKLGMFDPPDQVPYATIPISIVGCEAHQALAYEAAVKSLVLLKNDGVLPVRGVRTISIVGPNAASIGPLLGNYYGLNRSLVTILEGIVGAVPEGVKVEYRQSFTLIHPNENRANSSIERAASSDVTIACIGLSPLLEGEEGDAILSAENGDRTEINLPQSQAEVLRQLAIHGAKLVLVVFGGSPVALGDLIDQAAAVIFVWYPGQEGGRAVADVLFGRVNPSGKLPITFPKSVNQLPTYEDYSMSERTYRYATWEPEFPFGFGLSYTDFAYHELVLESNTLSAGQSLRGSFLLENTGDLDGEEVYQLYLSDLEASVVVPFHHLVGFGRVVLKAGEKRSIQFTIKSEEMMLVDDNGEFQLEPGFFRLTIGGTSPIARAQELGAAAMMAVEFEVRA